MSVRSESAADGRQAGQWRWRMTREGWLGLGLAAWLLAASFMSHASLMLLVFSVLLGGLAVAWFQGRRMTRRLRVRAELPEQVVAGRPFTLRLTVHNGRRLGRAAGLVFSSRVRRYDRQEIVRIQVGPVPAGRQRTERAELVLARRGLYQFERLQVASRYPLGIVESWVPVAGDGRQVLALPPLGRINRRLMDRERLEYAYQEGRRGLFRAEGEYHGLRPFREGDSPRWIHWPTSARQAKLMVKEFESRRHRDAAVLLDPWLPQAATARQQELLELAVSFAATLCSDLCRRPGLHLVLAMASEPVRIEHGMSSPRLLQTMLEHLSLVEGIESPPWERLMAELPLSWAKHMRAVIVTPRRFDPLARLHPDHAAQAKSQMLLDNAEVIEAGSDQFAECFELIGP